MEFCDKCSIHLNEFSYFYLQQNNNVECCTRWQWQVGYIYTNILKEICLHGIRAELQKTAFLGFCDCVKELKDDKELRCQLKEDKELKGASFLDLLNYSPSSNCKYQRS